jgi:hypothetical protein
VPKASEHGPGQRFRTASPDAVEVEQATGAATLAGAQATQAAAQAGTTTTVTAMNAGTVGMMATGSVGLVVGIFLGIVIRSAR